MKIKKYLEIISYYLLPLILLIISLSMSNKDLFNNFGNGALIIIISILFLKPIAKILNIKKLKYLLIYRRQLGIASFWLAAFHTLGMLQITSKYTNLKLYFNPKINLLYGIIAIIAMLILTITSNDWAVKKLKTNWQKIQYLAYPTLFIILYHQALAKNEINKFYIISILFILLKILEWLKISFKKKIVA